MIKKRAIWYYLLTWIDNKKENESFKTVVTKTQF